MYRLLIFFCARHADEFINFIFYQNAVKLGVDQYNVRLFVVAK
jgi:hypothetical protein